MLVRSLPPAVAGALDAPTRGRRVTVQAAGIPWSGLTWGEDGGRPLLLIHGVTASAATWWRVGPALAASGRTVMAVDLPGHGLTGHWLGHHRFRDNAADVLLFADAAGLITPSLQVVGHSWGAVTAAALPAAGMRPATLVLLDPPTVPHAIISAMAADPDERTYDDLAEASAAVRRDNPEWTDEDVLAKAEALTQLDADAARAVLLENGDWDGGLRDLAEPAAASVSTWVVRGDPRAGGLVPDASVAVFEARIGAGRVHTVTDGPHSPQRTHPVETTAAILAALDAG